MKTRVLIIVSKDKKKALQLTQEIESFLKKQNIESEIFLYNGFVNSIQNIKEKGDYTHAISLGGDGTVLFATRLCAPLSIPIFPINFGRFGFIASIQPSEWEEQLQDFIKGKSEIYKRIMLKATIVRENDEIMQFEALNDIVVLASSIGKLVNIEVGFNGITFGMYTGDGVMISTPTGSTAYSVALGSPILDPTVSAFLLTPMSPFSLSNRPIVLPSSGNITLKVPVSRHTRIAVIRDGQKLFTLKPCDIVCITESPHKALLAECSPLNFYSALKSKLGWQGSAL